MNYYNEIKNKIIDNEIFCKAKNYSRERNTVVTYFEIGKLLFDAGSKYGEAIITKYSEKLQIEVGRKYNNRTLRRIRQYYVMFKDEKWSPLATKLTWSHYCELLAIKDENEVLYYIQLCIKKNLTKRELRQKIKTNEYERLDENTKLKIINEEKGKVSDFIKNPIIINNKSNYELLSEKVIQKIILEDIENFMSELGNYFCFISSEYKIKIGAVYNYIDLLLYNIEFNCYVVVELKITELKKEHIGQIQVYMNYINSNLKTDKQEKTIGIIICKKDNKFIMEYCSDSRIITKEYELI